MARRARQSASTATAIAQLRALVEQTREAHATSLDQLGAHVDERVEAVRALCVVATWRTDARSCVAQAANEQKTRTGALQQAIEALASEIEQRVVVEQQQVRR